MPDNEPIDQGVREIARPPVKVKLLTFWMRDKEFPIKEPHKHFISHGVWQTSAVEWKDHKRVYELTCAWPMHDKRKVGDTIKMYEGVLIALCHPVEITHLPKILPDTLK